MHDESLPNHLGLYVSYNKEEHLFFSHLLRKQGKTKKAVSNYSVSPTINDEVLKKATLTLRENSTHSFEIVESLVEEEVSYTSGVLSCIC